MKIRLWCFQKHVGCRSVLSKLQMSVCSCLSADSWRRVCRTNVLWGWGRFISEKGGWARLQVRTQGGAARTLPVSSQGSCWLQYHRWENWPSAEGEPCPLWQELFPRSQALISEYWRWPNRRKGLLRTRTPVLEISRSRRVAAVFLEAAVKKASQTSGIKQKNSILRRWGASMVALWWRISLQCGRPGFDTWVGKIPWRRKWQPTPVF